MIGNAYDDAIAQGSDDADVSGLTKRYGNKVTSRAFDGQTNMVSEMTALIAYLQRLGNLVDFTTYNPDLDPRNLPHGAQGQNAMIDMVGTLTGR